jgi:hypothetical protein
MLAPTRDDLRAEQQGGVSLWYIATRAGVSDKSGNWILNYVRLLVANEDFPKPLPYYGLNEKKRQGLTLHSRWNRVAVDAWFDGFLPPRLVAVAEERRPPTTRISSTSELKSSPPRQHAHERAPIDRALPASDAAGR